MDPLEALTSAHPSLRPFDPAQRERLRAYEDWLATEAIEAGGVGPGERPHLFDRHVLDSLLFAVAATEAGVSRPSNVLDIGAGVGLPAIPLAITWPESDVIALDRSGRRSRLCRRVARILGLTNIEVVQRDVTSFSGRFPLVTSRASLPPPALRPHLRRLTDPDGVAIVAGSADARVEYEGYITREYALKPPDLRRWMLIMRPSNETETEEL